MNSCKLESINDFLGEPIKMVYLRNFILFSSLFFSYTSYSEDTAPITITSYKRSETMQIIKIVVSFSAFIASLQVFAQLPAEVISSCIDNKATRPTVTMTTLTDSRFKNTDEIDCEDHFENAIDGLKYGGILCGNYGYIILNNNRIKLSNAKNYSINPTIKPGEIGAHLDSHSYWSKLEFSGNTYLCIERALSESGAGASVNQYYIVENPYSAAPTLNYYFLTEDIMPLESLTD